MRFDKVKLLDAAEVIDSFRLVPRIILFCFGYWTIDVTYRILFWYFKLPSAERTLETSGLAMGIITAVTGLLTLVIKDYTATGREWGIPPQVQQTSVTKTTVTQ